MIDLMQHPDIRDIEQFLFHEADLLDQNRFSDWQELFTEDGDYWLPAVINQPDPLHHVSLIYEDRLLRAVRIKRFSDENAYSVNPAPRSSHLVSNIRIESFDEQSGRCQVRSNFVVTQYRRGEKSIFTGSYRHDLAILDSGFKIRCKRVDLIDCDGFQGDILIYI